MLALNTDLVRPHKILVIGGAYAGLSLIQNLLRQAKGLETDGTPSKNPLFTRKPLEITVLDERDGFYHTIGTPLSFASREHAPKFWRKFEDIPKLKHASVSVLRGKATSIDPEKKIATYLPVGSQENKTQSYDYLAVCTGLRRQWPVVPESHTRSEYVNEAQDFIKGIEEAGEHGVAVIGAGAVGIEVAAELKMLYPNKRILLIHAHETLLTNEPLPETLKDCAKQILKDLGMEFVLNERVSSTTFNPEDKTYTIKLQSGKSLSADKVINSVSRYAPNTEFLPETVLSDHKYINIRSSLQLFPSSGSGAGIPNADFHFAAGDIGNWSGIKRVGQAMHMGAIAGVNIYRHILSLEEQESSEKDVVESKVPAFEELKFVPNMIALACGKEAVTYSPADGLNHSEELMKAFFGDDLGFDICWNAMKLGESYD